MKNAIVIPCYNEANRLKFDEFQKFVENHTNYHLCFVNDGSSDETIVQLREFASQNTTQVTVVDLTVNQGKAEAVRQGILTMTQREGLETIGFIDADLATGFEDYLRLVAGKANEDKRVVIGSRKKGDCNGVERSAFRSFASYAVGRIIKSLIELPICDTQCGAKVFDVSTAAYLFDRPFVSKWLFDVELFLRLKSRYGHQAAELISEVGLNNWTEVEGSKISMSASLKFPVRLLEIALEYRLKPRIQDVKEFIALNLALSKSKSTI